MSESSEGQHRPGSSRALKFVLTMLADMGPVLSLAPVGFELIMVVACCEQLNIIETYI